MLQRAKEAPESKGAGGKFGDDGNFLYLDHVSGGMAYQVYISKGTVLLS